MEAGGRANPGEAAEGKGRGMGGSGMGSRGSPGESKSRKELGSLPSPLL